MQSKINAFIDSLILYDYILLSSGFLLFILLVSLGIILRRRLFISITFILIAFAILILAPTLGRSFMHDFLFTNTTTLDSQKRLEFTEAIVVKGAIENTSKFHFNECIITANVYKVSKNTLRNYLFSFKRIKKMSILAYDIEKGTRHNFKIIVDPFYYKKEYKITLEARCK